MWQEIYAELKTEGFIVLSVALDKSAEAARPWIEQANPKHPSLIDTQHLVADIYSMINVPTVVWIDETGKIVRPNDAAFVTDKYQYLTARETGAYLHELRAWVQGRSSALSAAEVRALQALPTPEMQLAKAEFGLGKWLYEHARHEEAARHFELAGDLAPHDFTIRRGSLPMRDLDPMGPVFRQMVKDWKTYYKPLPF